MEETVKDRILAYMKAKSLSQNRFEEAIDMSHGYINNLKSSPTAKVLQKIFYTFPDLNQSWLLTGNGTMLNTEERKLGGIPLVPQDAMGGALAGQDNQWMPYNCEWYVIPAFIGADFLMTVQGDSMMPDYLPGDLVACRRVPLDRLWFQWGKIYIIDTDQGPLIKKIMPSDKEGYIKIVSANPNYPPFDLETTEIHGVALVDGLIRK